MHVALQISLYSTSLVEVHQSPRLEAMPIEQHGSYCPTLHQAKALVYLHPKNYEHKFCLSWCWQCSRAPLLQDIKFEISACSCKMLMSWFAVDWRAMESSERRRKWQLIATAKVHAIDLPDALCSKESTKSAVIGSAFWRSALGSATCSGCGISILRSDLPVNIGSSSGVGCAGRAELGSCNKAVHVWHYLDLPPYIEQQSICEAERVAWIR